MDAVNLHDPDVELLLELVAARRASVDAVASAERDATDAQALAWRLDHIQEILERRKSRVDQRIAPPVVEHLLTLTREVLQEMDQALARSEAGDDEGNDWVDGNDYVIWHSFVLHALEQHRLDGLIPANDLLGKGFGFLIDSIPAYLHRHPALAAVDRGALLKLFTTQHLERVRRYLDWIEAEWFVANWPSIQNQLRSIANAGEP